MGVIGSNEYGRGDEGGRDVGGVAAEGCWVWRLGLSIDVGELDEDDGWVWSVGNEGGGAWAAWARRADGI